MTPRTAKAIPAIRESDATQRPLDSSAYSGPAQSTMMGPETAFEPTGPG
ncbi:MAG: hypothetical protein MZU95_04955 [Desulfomicrobium escambiense]|nr:hypothetical protein [Desulfomicrobium escambiense]